MGKILAPLLVLLCTPAWAMQVPARIEGTSLNGATKIALEMRDQTTVVVFLSSRCPCSMSHEPVLKELAQEFKEARFIGVHSNADENVQESTAHFARAGLPFPVIQDHSSELANQLGALKTPHVFVINKAGEIIFQGGIDDSHNASRASHPFLKAALTALREGKSPEITQARSLGCIIRR